MSGTNHFANYSDDALSFALENNQKLAKNHGRWAEITQVWCDLERDGEAKPTLEAMHNFHARMADYYTREAAEAGDEQGRRDMHNEAQAQNAQYEATCEAQYNATCEDPR